ncbi:MAG: TaqI-like C-terminal specificity domain-containing protein [Deltaproteobacteria bacterium]
MPAPQIILELIERFGRNLDAYKSGAYNETQTRHEFIDPFFEALGWDVNNTAGNAEAYKDVIHEDAVKVSGITKAPDYSFRIGGARKFFVEAKKPSVYIKDAPAAAFQVRRYAWSAKLPLSIVTDFEELAVYDCRFKPDQNDKADNARIKYYTFRQYAEKWDEIAAIFSKEAILKGSFDKYAESNKGKRGTAEVDSAFLAEIESWRDILARNIALRNSLSVRELNDSVQRIIDRVIFLRIAEDRGIEDYGSLRGICNGNNSYGRLQELFYKADDRYNSGLFHFRTEKDETEPPDILTTTLVIDDKPLKDILKTLYYPDSPYEFAVLPADILGQVYEQFLGKVIRLSSDHRAVVEDKPEVKKAGGVFYTPTYIVEYIVKNTVGKLLDGKTPKKAENLRILDPACGSGSFLLGAYQYLLDWHLNYYTENNPEKHAREKRPAIFSGQGGAWHLTTAERKRILLNNIYGVDIDSQAVEVTKLSLLLKVLEGETGESLNQQRKLFSERALPNLGGNIKCGNSLIGSDFYNGKQMNLLDTEEAQRVNVFDWQAEFPEIFKAGGFDAVIGNPPYGATFSRTDQDYLQIHYQQAQKFPDSYCYFIVKGSQLLRHEGFMSLIVPNTFCDIESCNDFRKWLLTSKSIESIWQTGWAFKAAIVDTVVFILRNSKPSLHANLKMRVEGKEYSRKNSEFLEDSLFKIDYRNSIEDKNILLKTILQPNLGSLAIVKAGVKLYEKGKGNPPQTENTLIERPYTKVDEAVDGWKLLYRGENVKRYHFKKSREAVNYGPWLAAPRSEDLFTSPKILMRRTSDKLFSCIDLNSSVCVNSCHVIKFRSEQNKLSYQYILGLLNSRLLQKIFEIHNPQMVGKVFAEVKVIYVERLPIRTIDFNKPAEKKIHENMVQLVDQMLALHKQLPEAKTSHEQTLIQRQIDATDRQIDKLVYELYSLTEEEIAIVEGQ